MTLQAPEHALGAKTTSSAAASNQAQTLAQYPNFPRIYVKEHEWGLFCQWLALPHPEFHVAACIENIGNLYEIPPLSPELPIYVAGIITAGQERRFALFAQALDIDCARIILSTFKRKLVEIQGVLEAEKEDQLADFDAEDFKRMEKEDDCYRE